MSDNENKQEFASLLVQYQKGIAHAKASEELRDAVAAVQELGKAAEVLIKVKISPMKDNPRVVQTLITSAAKIPKPAPVPAIYFPDDDGVLHRNDPTQREFDYGPNAVVMTTQAPDGKTAAAGSDK